MDEIYHLAEIYIALRTHNVKRNRSLNKANCDLVILITVPTGYTCTSNPKLANKKSFIVKSSIRTVNTIRMYM